MVDDWEYLDSQPAVDYGILRLRRDRRRSPRTRQAHEVIVLEMPDWTNVVAVTPDQEVVLIRQFRHGMGVVELEIPGGIVDPADSGPLAAARRELAEETGYGAAAWIAVGSVAPNPAIQNNRCHTFLALGAAPLTGQSLDTGEDIGVERVAVADIPALIRSGAIDHGLVVAAFHFVELYRQRCPGPLLP
jgi:8-oxo-dGTP pyrophosphatase MutT (NUDIX family)